MRDQIENNEYYIYNKNDLKGRETGGDSGGTDMPITISRDDITDTFQVGGNYTVDSALQSSLMKFVRNEGNYEDLRQSQEIDISKDISEDDFVMRSSLVNP